TRALKLQRTEKPAQGKGHDLACSSAVRDLEAVRRTQTCVGSGVAVRYIDDAERGAVGRGPRDVDRVMKHLIALVEAPAEPLGDLADERSDVWIGGPSDHRVVGVGGVHAARGIDREGGIAGKGGGGPAVRAFVGSRGV